MNEKADRILARQKAALEKGAETMWHEMFAQLVIEMMNRNPTLSLAELRNALEDRLAEDATDRITKARCRGALDALRA